MGKSLLRKQRGKKGRGGGEEWPIERSVGKTTIQHYESRAEGKAGKAGSR